MTPAWGRRFTIKRFIVAEKNYKNARSRYGALTTALVSLKIKESSAVLAGLGGLHSLYRVPPLDHGRIGLNIDLGT